MSDNFIPKQPEADLLVPFYDDVSSKDGWEGQASDKSIATLKSEITTSISRLGGMVTGFQQGTFRIGGHDREGFRIHFTIEDGKGNLVPCKTEIAALPVREPENFRRGQTETMERRRDKSLRMSLYMFREAMNGLFFLGKLSPGYAPLMPFILATKDKTISQLWAESPIMKHLLPDNVSNADFITLEGKEVK